MTMLDWRNSQDRVNSGVGVVKTDRLGRGTFFQQLVLSFDDSGW